MKTQILKYDFAKNIPFIKLCFQHDLILRSEVHNADSNLNQAIFMLVLHHQVMQISVIPPSLFSQHVYLLAPKIVQRLSEHAQKHRSIGL